MKHLWWKVSVGLGVSVLFAVSSAFGQAKPVELKYSMHFVATHKQCQLGVDWGKEVEKRTGGKVKVTMYPGGTLTPSNQNYDGITKGISDVGLSFFSYTQGKFPVMEIGLYPLAIKSGMAATVLSNEVYKKFNPKELDGVKVMYLAAHGPGIIHTRDKAVHKLEDVRGLKIRCGGLSAKIAKALGGVPVNIPIGESYDALKKGVANAMFVSLEAMEQWRFGEVLKYSIGNFGSAYTSVMYVAMNKQKWESLPPEVKKVIEGINEEWIGKTGKAWDDVDQSAKEWILKRGNEYITLTDEENERWAKTVAPLLDEFVKETEKKGAPGQAVLQFAVERVKQLNKEYPGPLTSR